MARSSASNDPLEAQLNRLAAAGARRLRRWALRCACDRWLRVLFPSALAISGFILLAVMLSAANPALNLWPFGIASTLALALGGPLIVAGACVLFDFVRRRVDRRMGLALYDRNLETNDRLQAADQFLLSSERSDFEQAAVEDARRFASAALEKELAPVAIRPPNMNPPHRRLGLLAIGLLALALWLGQQPGSQALAEESLVAEAIAGDMRERTLPVQLEPEPLAERPASPPARRKARAEVSGAEAENSGGESQRSRSSLQPQNADPNAAGSEARRSNQARQAQSGASGQRSRSQERDESNKRKAKPKKDRPASEAPNQPQQAAGLKGGKGDMSGGRMAASEHASAQDNTQQPEPEGDSDDGGDEEDEEQKAGAGSKPLINQRKSPVDRSLTPSADGGEERDDLNGRGGPGGLKKTRGVAAMLLGVPLPDYLQGKVNPGRMKIQSEQGLAEEHQAEPATARARPPRDATVGYALNREIPPSDRDVVRNYFVARRANGGEASGGTPEDP